MGETGRTVLLLLIIVNTDSRKFSFLDQGIGLSPSLNYDLGMPKSTMFNAYVINELRNELMNIGWLQSI